MTDPLDGVFDDPADQASGQKPAGGKLREQLEAVLEQNRLLREQIETDRAAERDRSLSAVFEKHKIPALARDLFPKDASPTDEAATALVEKYGSLWGATSATATTSPDQQTQTRQIQSFNSGAPEPVGLELTEEQLVAKFAETNSPAEVNALFAQLAGSATDS